MARLRAYLLATAALWARIPKFLKNSKMSDITKGVANTVHSSPPKKIYVHKRLSFFSFEFPSPSHMEQNYRLIYLYVSLHSTHTYRQSNPRAFCWAYFFEADWLMVWREGSSNSLVAVCSLTT